MKKPELGEPCCIAMRKIFDELDKARASIKSAEKCPERSDAIYYRSSLEALVRLEAQADALAYVYQTERKDLRKWVEDKFDYYRFLEAKSS